VQAGRGRNVPNPSIGLLRQTLKWHCGPEFLTMH
jgi:hypothetical protein